MPDDLTGTAPAGTEGDAPAGTAATGTEDPTAKAIQDARLRQAGAERARQEAERLLAEAQSTIASLKSGKAADPANVDVKEAIKQALAEQRTEFEQTLAQATAKAQGEALDARFPAARKKFPEVTDPIKLSELEVLYGEQPENPTPMGNNPQRTATGGPKNIEDMSSKELQEYMRTLDPSVAGLNPT